MRKMQKRSFWDIALDALRGLTTMMFGQPSGDIRRLPKLVYLISSDPVVIKAGEKWVWDRRALPARKEVSIECDCCGEHTFHFTVLRCWRYFLHEKEALGHHFKAMENTLLVATVWNMVCLSAKCEMCHKMLEAHISFDQ